MNKETQEKYEKLLDVIRPHKRAVVAFSGGVDSTLLAYAAAEALGRENVVCVTARAAAFPLREFEDAAAFCAMQGIRHELIDFDGLGVDGFAANPPDRCYLCKFALFSKFIEFAKGEGIEAVFDGSNTDDTGDYRPGMRAILELGVKSPLCEAGLSKADIRAILKDLGLPAWDKPPLACLATRIPYGEAITVEKLGMAERAEQFLFDKGFKQARVRVHGNNSFTARIEVMPEEIAGIAGGPLRKDIDAFFKSLGFTYVTLDLTGYRMGSMNEGLQEV